jgi:hypothetical protein
MSNLTLFENNIQQAPAKALLAAGIDAALGEGIRASYGILGIKAGKFRIKYRGTEEVVMKVDQDTGQKVPVSSLEVVIIKANPFLTKQFYVGPYVEGSNAAPDCYSLDGKVPSPQVPKPINASCVMCPKNQYGSLISDSGVKQKACRDSKKLAIVPLGNLRNEIMNGPMLFRVPPSSLKDLSNLADAMKARGYPYNSVAVRISFDLEVSHPKPIFRAVRPLTDAEAEIVLELYHGDQVHAILADNDPVPDTAVAPVDSIGQFEQEPISPVVSVPAGTPIISHPAPIQAVPTQTFPTPAPSLSNGFTAPPAPAQAAQNGSAPTPIFQPPRGPGRPRKVQPEAPAPAPVLVEPTLEPKGSALDEDIAGILTSLNSFNAK